MKLKEKATIYLVRTWFNMLALASERLAAEKAFKLFCTPHLKRKGLTLAPPIFQNAEKLQVILDNKRLAGYRFNHPQQKKALILHGFTSSVIFFEKYVMALVDKGFEVIAFDAPAHGQSEGRQVTVLKYLDMIKAIHQSFGPIHSFMAHSFGGQAVTLALEQLAHTSETRVALVAPATETTTAIDAFFNYLQLGNKLRPAFEQVIVDSGKQPSSWYSVARAMKKIQASVLWIHDEDDDVTPLKDVQPVIDAHYPNVQFHITRGLGHRRIYRDDAVVKLVTEFLSRV